MLRKRRRRPGKTRKQKHLGKGKLTKILPTYQRLLPAASLSQATLVRVRKTTKTSKAKKTVKRVKKRQKIRPESPVDADLLQEHYNHTSPKSQSSSTKSPRNPNRKSFDGQPDPVRPDRGGYPMPASPRASFQYRIASPLIAAFHSLDAAIRCMEDKIRSLCAQILATKDGDKRGRYSS